MLALDQFEELFPLDLFEDLEELFPLDQIEDWEELFPPELHESPASDYQLDFLAFLRLEKEA